MLFARSVKNIKSNQMRNYIQVLFVLILPTSSRNQHHELFFFIPLENKKSVTSVDTNCLQVDGLNNTPSDEVCWRHDNFFVRNLFNLTVVHELNILAILRFSSLDGRPYLPTYHEMEN